MNRALKIGLLTGGAIISIPAALFLFAFFGSMFGLYETPKSALIDPQDVRAESSDRPELKVQAETQTDVVIPKSPIQSVDKTYASSGEKISIPTGMNASETFAWLDHENFIQAADGSFTLEYDKFARLSLEDSLSLYEMFKTSANRFDMMVSTPETEAERTKFDLAKLWVFAGASALQAQERRGFAKKAGAVLPPSTFQSSTYTGDYMRLLRLYTIPKFGFEERILRDYAKVMSDKEVLEVLEELGALTIPSNAVVGQNSNRWQIHPGEALSGFDVETLQAFHDAIDDRMFGDRRKLRKKIQNIIDAQHTADDMEEN